MWFDGIRQPNTLYVANTSRGKDSTAMLQAIQLMGWPLDMICSVDIWATQDIPAELPPMVAFKDEYDKKVLERFGIPVTRLCASKRERERETGSDGECHSWRLSYEDLFYERQSTRKNGEHISGFPCTMHGWCKRLKDTASGRDAFKVDLRRHILSEGFSQERERERIAMRQKRERELVNLRIPDAFRQLVSVRPQTIGTYGFPNQKCRWCTGELKNAAHIRSKDFLGEKAPGAKTGSREPLDLPLNEGQKINIVHYIGIAADEPKRIAKHMPAKDKVLPLVQIGWDEALCGLEAQYMDMLSPAYTTSMRDGCWFCHNQSVGQLRILRKNYPNLWELLLKWDKDSPVTFHADGHTVHDFDRRFQLEDEGFLYPDDKVFRWSMLDDHLQYRLF